MHYIDNEYNQCLHHSLVFNIREPCVITVMLLLLQTLMNVLWEITAVKVPVYAPTLLGPTSAPAGRDMSLTAIERIALVSRGTLFTPYTVTLFDICQTGYYVLLD